MELCDTKKCTGCFACMNACPRDAIHVSEDRYGKTIPQIDAVKCVNCGLCRKACPELNVPALHEPLSCLAAWTNVPEDREKSTSGGVATALSRVIMKENGAVFGCAYGKNLVPEIRQADSEDDLRLFRGSKYVQSFTGFSYREVRECLKNGQKVLYIGTPCQISGLKQFIGKNDENLFTVDIICHGGTPVKYLQDYVWNKVGKNADRVTFRDTDDYGKNSFRVFSGEKQLFDSLSYKDYYYESFLKGLTYRDNCYSCKYASAKRVSDLTVGDFWGINRNTLRQKTDNRISVVLVNTAHGHDLMKMAEEILHMEERDISEAVDGNKQLRSPSVAPEDRQVFLDNLDRGFEAAVLCTEVGRNVSNNIKVSSPVYRVIQKLRRVLNGKEK